MKKLILTIVACVALLVAGCGGGDDSSSDSTEASTTTQANPPLKKTKPTVTVPKGAPPKQLETKELEEGTGPAAKAGDLVVVHYVGVTYKDGKEFDSSWSRSEPFGFTIGSGEVIPGWEQGLVGMKVGGRRELIVPGELAYGEAGFPPAIGPNETLVFVIDLLDIK